MISEEKFIEMSNDLKKIIVDYNNLQSICTNSDSFKETEECFTIFMDLGYYLKSKMKQELRCQFMKKAENAKTEVGNKIEEDISGQLSERKESEVMLKTEILSKKAVEDILPTRHFEGIYYPCKECKFVAPNFKILKGHSKLEHTKTEMKICIKCGFESMNKKEFEKHIKIVHAKSGKLKILKQ